MVLFEGTGVRLEGGPHAAIRDMGVHPVLHPALRRNRGRSDEEDAPKRSPTVVHFELGVHVLAYEQYPESRLRRAARRHPIFVRVPPLAAGGDSSLKIFEARVI